jgi:hypothetical protein
MPDNWTAPVHKFLSEGLTLDEVIVELKRIGFDRELSVVALQRATTMSRDVIEERVRRHPAWVKAAS